MFMSYQQVIRNGRVLQVHHTNVIGIEDTSLYLDDKNYLVHPGDSGGGGFVNNQLVANNRSIRNYNGKPASTATMNPPDIQHFITTKTS